LTDTLITVLPIVVPVTINVPLVLDLLIIVSLVHLPDNKSLQLVNAQMVLSLSMMVSVSHVTINVPPVTLTTLLIVEDVPLTESLNHIVDVLIDTMIMVITQNVNHV
jgi:hypothetical protein